jgi:hypothetical protein
VWKERHNSEGYYLNRHKREKLQTHSKINYAVTYQVHLNFKDSALIKHNGGEVILVNGAKERKLKRKVNPRK